MKVGVLTMHRVKNHGSFLQAYALCNLIKEHTGSEVCLVDFETESGVRDFCRESKKALKSHKLKYLCVCATVALARVPVLGKLLLKSRKIKAWKNLLSYYKLYINRYEKKFWRLLPIADTTLKNADVDILVIGSDEVFNYKINSSVGYSDELFGEGSRADKTISFAASFGCTDISDISESQTKMRLAGYLSDFAAISVRDKNSVDNVKFLLGDDAEVGYHLDPVFHYGFEDELVDVKRKRPYLAVYAYDGLEQEHREAIAQYARERGLDILCFLGYQGDFGEYVSASPFETLSYIKGAECVVTTTFHGAVFSIKYNKPFCALLKDKIGTSYNNNSKLGDLLSRLGLVQRAVASLENLNDILAEDIEYENEVNKKVQEQVSEGISYLQKQVGDMKK